MDVITLLREYIKTKLNELYQDDNGLIDPILKALLLNIMLQEYESNEKYRNYTDLEKLFYELYEIARNKAIKEDDGTTFFIKPTNNDEFHTRSIEEEPKKKELPKTRPTKPQKQLITVDKVSNKIFSKEIAKFLENDCVSVNMNVAKRGKKKINTLVTINYSELKRRNISGVQRLTQFDRAVLDAINTIYKAGNRYMTIEQIFKVMSGKENGRVRPTMKEKMNRSIQKMMVVLVTINNDEEVEAYNTNNIKVTENILKATYVEFENSGNKVEGIRVDNSIILQYAETRNQIDSSMPLEIMDTPINKNETNIAIQSYLYRRVLAIKNGGNMSNKILLNTLLDDLEIIETTKKLTSTQRDKRKKVVDTIISIFDYWKEKGFISAYEIEGKRPVRGFKVYYNSNVIENK